MSSIARRFSAAVAGIVFPTALSGVVLSAQTPNVVVQVGAPPGVDTLIYYQRTITRAGVDSSGGTRSVALRANGGMLEVVQRFQGGGGFITDTAVADLATLHAVAHRSHQPSKTMRFEFTDGHAKGSVILLRPADDSTIAVDQDVGGAIFDSNIIELVVAALPLREGFTTALPFYIYERGGRVVMPVAVGGHSLMEFASFVKREVWVVSVGVPGAPATIWVDARTHAVLRVRYEIAARGMAFTDDRITPLPN